MSKLSKAIANAIIEFNAGLLTQDELYQKLEHDLILEQRIKHN